MGINVPRPDLTNELAKTLDEILKQSMKLIRPEIRNLLPEELTNVQSFSVQTTILPDMLKQYSENFIKLSQSSSLTETVSLSSEDCARLVSEFTDRVLEISRKIQEILRKIRLENTDELTPEIRNELQECIGNYAGLLIDIVTYLPEFKELTTDDTSTDLGTLNAW